MVDRDAGRERRRAALLYFFKNNRDALKSVNHWALTSGVAERTLAQFMNGSRSKNMRADTYERLSDGAKILTGRNVSIFDLMGEAFDNEADQRAIVIPTTPSAPPPDPELTARVTRRLIEIGVPEGVAAIAADGAAERLADIDAILNAPLEPGETPALGPGEEPTAEVISLQRRATEILLSYPPEEREAVIRLLLAAAPKNAEE